MKKKEILKKAIVSNFDSTTLISFQDNKNSRLSLENSNVKPTVSARLEPHSWLQPHPFKFLIHPQSRADNEIIEPHLE